MCHTRPLCSRSALATTETELNAIATAATTGLSGRSWPITFAAASEVRIASGDEVDRRHKIDELIEAIGRMTRQAPSMADLRALPRRTTNRLKDEPTA
jgi:hypothetical protein